MSIDSQARYTKTHEWVRKEGDLFVYGITDHAQSELSDIVYVELPEVGATFGANDAIGVIESVKAASDLIIPVDAEIVEVNDALGDSPDVVNTDPYGAGWIVKFKMVDPAAWDQLLTGEDYAKLIGE